jgi:hypothetical protein
VTLLLLVATEKVRAERRSLAVFAVLVVGALVAWSLLHRHGSSKYFDWSQEVRLSQSSSLWIKRHTTFGRFGEVTQLSQLRSLQEDFEFIHPQTGALIVWKGQPTLEPLLLDFDQGIPYLATMIKQAKHYEWNCPPHPYAFFKFVDGQWRRIGIKSLPARFGKANILPSLDGATRSIIDHDDHMMALDFVDHNLKPPVPADVLAIDRRLVNPMYFCRGSTDVTGSDGLRRMVSLDTFYGNGTGKLLGDRFGWNAARKDYLTEQDSIELGINEAKVQHLETNGPDQFRAP